ncbi:hypothetical protein VF13_41190 [Nostoc linckia z16]|nr:hypothetical protein VF13_41190 [Nostoc linckia z16]
MGFNAAPSIFLDKASPPKQIKKLIEMISINVPTACFRGSFAKNSKAGIIGNPPPPQAKFQANIGYKFLRNHLSHNISISAAQYDYGEA